MNFLIKVILILFIYPSLIASTSSSSTQQLPPTQNLTINVNAASNNNPTNTLTANQTANQKSSQEMTHTHTHIMKIDWPAFNCPNFKMPSMQNKLKPYYDNCWNYKWYILGSCAAASYLYLNIKIYNINQLLENPKSWCLWKEEIPLNRLMTIDVTELLKQLKIDVCKKYFNSVDAIKDSELLAKFLEDVTQEKNLLEFYQSIYNFSSTLYISKLFIINPNSKLKKAD